MDDEDRLEIPPGVENELTFDGWQDLPLSEEEYRKIEGLPQKREDKSDERSSK